MRGVKRFEKVAIGLCSAVVVGILLLVVINPFGRVEIRVLNDTGRDLAISDCVDDSAHIDAGDTFRVYGVPEGDRLMCWEYLGDSEVERCIAIPHAHEIHGTFLLSHALRRPKSDCESGWTLG